MLNRLIKWSLGNRALVLCVSLVFMVLGIRMALRLPVEVLPDLTKPTVVVLTEAPGLAPEEVESRVTQPLESALSGVAGLTRLRSNSDVSLSLVYVEFDWGTDIFRARTLVRERLQTVKLPEGMTPVMTPVASLMGEILLVGVRSKAKEGEPNYLPPREVRSIADWTIRRRLQSIPGIAEILNMGGGVQQIEIQPDPHRMQAHKVTAEELEAAVRDSAATTTGGFINSGATEVMVRNLAMTTKPGEIAATAIRKTGDRTITIGDVAKVTWGIEPMRGDAGVSIAPETTSTPGVIMSVTKAPGFDTRKLTDQVNAALQELAPSLPDGVETILLFQQKDFIDHAIGNLKEVVRDGAIMVSVVLFLFLLKVRTTLITLVAMPMSFAITMIVFWMNGISVNSMTLGGLAVAIGMVVDDAIVDVENVFRRLRENAALPVPQPKIQVIGQASSEVRNSILYATILIILVFLPLLGLSGVEGRLFTPIAVTTMIAMVASFVVSLTVIPVLCSLLLAPARGGSEKESRLARGMKWLLERSLLALALRQPLLVLAAAGVMLAASFSLYPRMTKEFLPKFQEETALVAATAAPGTSLPEMSRICDVIERQILSVEGVGKVGRRLGRAERGDHVVPVSTVEFDVDFRAGGSQGQTRDRKEIIEEINRKIRNVPGIFAVTSGPLADRIGHMMSGVSAPVAVKIFGPDIERLRDLGNQVRDIARNIPGFENAKIDQASSIPQLRVEPDRERAAAYGIAPGRIASELSALVGGKQLGELRENQRAVNLVMRLPEEWRNSPDRIANLPLHVADDQYVPVSLVADVREAKGPNLIFRENGQRRFVVAIKPSAGDVQEMVEQLRKKVMEKVVLPQGYFISYEGEFEAQREATLRIGGFSLIVLLAVFTMLAGYFKSASLALQVLVNIPLALMGGLVFTWLKVGNISIATLVGFIAVGGVAARNGIMMISHYLHLMRHEGESFSRAMIARGTKERLVPVLMTALSAGIGLIPLVMAADQPGKEILHPVAVVIVGGLISSTFLDMAVTPAMFWLFGRKAAARSIMKSAPVS